MMVAGFLGCAATARRNTINPIIKLSTQSLFYYPYYYFPHNYWPAMSPQWPAAWRAFTRGRRRTWPIPHFENRDGGMSYGNSTILQRQPFWLDQF